LLDSDRKGHGESPLKAKQYSPKVAQQSTGGIPAAAYSERLIVPWWWWPPSLALAALGATEIFLGASNRFAWIPYVVLLGGVIAALIGLSRIRIAVADGMLHVDDAKIPVTFLTEINILDAESKREVMGALADPMAFVVQRPWVRGAVRVVVDDPDDPTPYWVISTRRPERLATAIVDAKNQSLSPR
jgi:Protein of unknown function (DUF3093)